METSDLKYYKGFFTPFFDIVETEFDKFSYEITKKGTPHFKSLIKASFVKCFQFNYHNSRPKDFKDSFFLLGTLRSICEDLISLCFLKKLKASEREELIQFNLNLDITKNLIVQDVFFKKYNPGQIVINAEKYASAEYIEFVKNKPTNRKKASTKGYKIYPSVFQMAKETNYLDLYNYLYYATSSLVHFRADTLLKMGWNKEPEDYKIGKYHYSVNNYYHYYSKFNLTYGSLLFCEYVKKFKKELDLPKYLSTETKYFRNSFDLFDWPEIMTHAHMNSKEPSEIDKQLQRSYYVVKNLR